jgi:DNA-binding response OmpR family regulator
MVPGLGGEDWIECAFCDLGRHAASRVLHAQADIVAGGQPVALTSGEFRLLEALVTRAGRVLSRDQLMDVCYGNDSPAFDRSIDVCIARLRKKLLDNPRNPAAIRTVRNGGYIFAARVTKAGNGQHEWLRAG